MPDEKLNEQIKTFIRVSFLDGDPKGELQNSTPLLEWGVLNSLNTVRLVAFIRDELGVKIPALDINGVNFKDVRSITELVAARRG
ncbi:acyl carrier protein [Streptomyces sp. NPDC058045]|uniref:acyl carrier protein n=1 Tax=Streptomyces sp. NPDC058045 TaxID=3346311 RepID=UPI0036EB54CC